jgi:DNA modification methylase
VEAVKASIRRFGFGAPIVANARDREIIAGHTRWKAARELGLELVPVRWLDLPRSEAHALALADNRLGELAPWDEAALGDALRELADGGTSLEGLGWDADDLGGLMTPEAESAATTPGDDEAPPADEQGEPDSRPGAVYDLGPHRLVCGDCLDAAVWAALMGDEKARMVWTDPPYGVGVAGGTHDPRRESYRSGDVVENDDLDAPALSALLVAAFAKVHAPTAPGAAWYVAAPAGPLFAVFGSPLAALGVWRQTLIWLKHAFVFGRSDYHYRHEPIFYGWTSGAAHYFADDRTQDTVLTFDRPPPSAKEHPTMKPVDLVRRCVANSSQPGWLVLDPFGGSGTTLIAAAMEGRRARLIEIAPRYCDVIRRRWTRWAKEHNQDPGPGALDG